MTKRKFNQLKKWYFDNLGILVLLLFLFIISTAVVRMPYLNFLFGPSISIPVFLCALYLFFPPSNKTLVFLAVVILIFSFVFVVLRLNFLVELLGGLLFLLIIFMFINYGRSLVEKEKG